MFLIPPRTEYFDRPAPSSMLTHLYFDLDGTLVNTTTGIVAAYKFMHDRYKLPHPSDAELRKWIGPPVRKVIGHFLGEGASDQEIEVGVGVMREYYFDRGWSECELYPGIKSLLDEARTKKVELSVVTSKNIVMAKKVLEHVKIDHYFREIFGPDLKVDREKTEMLGEIVRRHNALPESSMMVGDSSYDILAARHVGMRAIGVTYGFGGIDDIQSCSPWKICHSVEEVSGVLYGAPTPLDNCAPKCGAVS